MNRVRNRPHMIYLNKPNFNLNQFNTLVFSYPFSYLNVQTLSSPPVWSYGIPKGTYGFFCVIPSALLSFLPYYCHSFWIIVIASVLVSFLLNIVVPSEVLSFQIFVILDSSSTLTYLKGEKIGCQSWPYLWVNANIFTFLRFTIRKETKLPFLLILAGTENSNFFPHQNINILFHKDTFNL